MLTQNIFKNLKFLNKPRQLLQLQLGKLGKIKSNLFPYNKRSMTDFEQAKINPYKIIKNAYLSVYDIQISRDSNNNNENEQEETTFKDNTKEHFFNKSDLITKLSNYLKSIESDAYSTSRVKELISLFDDKYIISMLENISFNLEINLKSVSELKQEAVELSNTKEKVEFHQKLPKYFLQLGKFLIKKNIYSMRHNVILNSRETKDNLLNLAEGKIIYQNLKLSEISDEDMILIFPVFMMINRIYNFPENLIENLLNDILERTIRLSISNKRDSFNIFKNYFTFQMINSHFLISDNYLRNLNLSIDFIIANNTTDMNDILYLITDNIFKFVVNSDKDNINNTNRIAISEEFLNKYLSSFTLIDYHGKFADYELIENFLAACILLHESCPEIFSMPVLYNLRNFINNGIFNYAQDKSELQILKQFCERPGNIELLLDLENKILKNLDTTNNNINNSHLISILNMVNSVDYFLDTQKFNYEKNRDLIFNSGIHFNSSKTK
jgi:hypothetical protein